MTHGSLVDPDGIAALTLDVPNQATSPGRQPAARAWRCVALVLAAVLLAAALLKAHELSTGPVLAIDLLHRRSTLALVVLLQFWLALWLICGVLPRAAWVAAVTCFTLLGAVAFGTLLSGTGDCGCFGALRVHPALTFALDLGALAALMWWRPPAPARPWGHAGRRALACAVVGVLVAIPGAWLMAGRASHRGQGAARSRIGAVLPAWVGSAFPLVEHTDIAGRLSAGRWIVLLYHHRCPRCRRALPRYEQLAGANAADPEAAGVALIQLPPFEPEPTGSAAGSGQAVRGRLADDRAWTFPTPLEVRIDNGVVTAVERPLDLPAAP